MWRENWKPHKFSYIFIGRNIDPSWKKLGPKLEIIDLSSHPTENYDKRSVHLLSWRTSVEYNTGVIVIDDGVKLDREFTTNHLTHTDCLIMSKKMNKKHSNISEISARAYYTNPFFAKVLIDTKIEYDMDMEAYFLEKFIQKTDRPVAVDCTLATDL